MNKSEEKIYFRFANLRTNFFQPISKFLTYLHITPDILSYKGMLLMVAFIFVASHSLIWGFWLIVIRMLLDCLDGPLARYQKTGSDQGKFVDVLMDQLGFAMFIFGIIKLGLVSGLVGAMYLYFVALVTILMIIKNSFKRQSDWLFFASAGAFPYVLIYLSYALFGLYAYGGSNYLDGSSKIFTALLVAKAIMDYRMVRTHEYNK